MELITDQHRELLPVEVIGGKASGLFRLKQLEPKLTEWVLSNYPGGVVVPKFFVVPVGYDLDGKVLDSAERIRAESFAVRSSSPFEDGTDYSFDGCFESVLNVNQSDLWEAISQVKASALGERAKKYAQDFGLTIDERMAVIVQEMISSGRKGIVYSKMPALINAVKVEVDGYEVGKKEILIKEKGPGGRLIVGNKDDWRMLDSLDDISQILESKWNCPVRIEFNTEYLNPLYLLQCRPLTNPDQTQFFFRDNGKPFRLIAETSDINMPCDVYYPLVNISLPYREDNLSFEDVKQLDQQHPEGYVLMCAYLGFWHKNYDTVTSNKKAVIVTTEVMGNNDHTADICRKRKIMYLKMYNLSKFMEDEDLDLKTGDMVRIKSDGITAQFYKEV